MLNKAKTNRVNKYKPDMERGNNAPHFEVWGWYLVLNFSRMYYGKIAAGLKILPEHTIFEARDADKFHAEYNICCLNNERHWGIILRVRVWIPAYTFLRLLFLYLFELIKYL